MDRVIDVVAGARPNFIKVAPLLEALGGHSKGLTTRLVHTGQHHANALSGVFFRDLGIRSPEVHLGVGSSAHGEQTARILAGFEKHLLEAEPRSCGVVVVGDVTSTMACALAAAKLHIPVAHVEAGLRSFDRSMPEEINRVVTDAVADLLLVSEPAGMTNLQREGAFPERIHYVGNVMIDTLARELPRARSFDLRGRLGATPGSYAYVTLHRPSNVDSRERLSRHIRVLQELAQRMPVYFPAHPRTVTRLHEFELIELLKESPQIQVLAPLGYHANLSLLSSSRVVVTDSGGVQEETTWLGIPCLTVRANTERPVTLSEGTNTLVGEDPGHLLALLDAALKRRRDTPCTIAGWDGRAAERIAAVLEGAWSRESSSEAL